MHAYMHHRCIYMCVCACMFAGVSSRTEHFVLSIEVWKSLFDISFLMRLTVPCVNVYNCPSTLRTVTGELLVVWTCGQLPPWSGSTDRASVHRSKCILCREGLCAGKQAMGLCSCLLLPFLLMEEHGHPLLPGPCRREVLVWGCFSSADLQNFWCGRAWAVGVNREAWGQGPFQCVLMADKEKYENLMFFLKSMTWFHLGKTLQVVKVNRNKAFHERIRG